MIKRASGIYICKNKEHARNTDLGIGASPLCNAKCGSLRIGVSTGVLVSGVESSIM